MGLDNLSIARGRVDRLWGPVRENLLVERPSGLRRRQTKISLQHLATHLKLAYRLVAASHRRIEHYESTMDVLPAGVVPKHLVQPIRGRRLSAPLLQRVCELHQESDIQLGKKGATLGAPVVIPVLGEELAAVGCERGLVRFLIRAAEGALSQLLEVIGIDDHMLRFKGENRLRQPQVSGALTRQQLGLEGTAGGMEGLTEAVERRLRRDARPEQLENLFTVQGVPRVCRQELRQRPGTAPLPHDRSRGADSFDTEPPEQLHAYGRYEPRVRGRPAIP